MYLLLFSGKFLGVFKVHLSAAVSVYVLSSRGANQLQVLYIRTLENIQKKNSCMESFSTEAAVLKCIPTNFFLKIRRCFRTTFKKLVLENHVLPHHTSDKDYAEIM